MGVALVIDDVIIETFDFTVNSAYGVNSSNGGSSAFTDIFSFFINGISSIVDVMKNMTVNWFGGLSFSIWHFMLGVLIVAVIVNFIFKQPTGLDTYVSDVKYKNAEAEREAKRTERTERWHREREQWYREQYKNRRK